MNNFQRVLKNTIFLTISEFLLKIAGLAWIIYLGQVLTVSLYGRYSFVNSFITIFSFLPEIGIGLIVVREIARHKERAYEYISSTFFINFLIGMITLLLIVTTGLAFGYSRDILILLVIASCTLFFASLRSAPLYYFEGIENMKVLAILNVVNTFSLIGGAIFGYWITNSLYGIFLGMLWGTIGSLFFCYGVFISYYKTLSIRFNWSQILSLISSGFPLTIASFSFLVYTRVDSIVLNNMLGEHAVGIYNSATPFVFSLIQLLNVPFVVALYPALSRIFKEDKVRFRKALAKSLIVIALWSFPLSEIVYFSSPHIIPFFFGDKFSAGIPILQNLIFFVPFASLSALLYKVLIIFNRQKLYMIINLFGAGIDIGFNIFFVGKYGIIGASYAAVLTQIILCTIYGVTVLTLLKNKEK